MLASEPLAGAPAAYAAGAPAPLPQPEPSPSPSDQDAASPAPAAFDVVAAEMLDAEPQLRRMLLRKFGITQHSAEDILSGVSERWLRAVKEGSDLPEHPRAYLFALTRNAAVDHLRRASSRPEVSTAHADWVALEPQFGTERSAEDVVTTGLRNKELLAKVQSLPHVQRRVIECLFVSGMTSKETARRLAISIENVDRNRLRALKALRAMYVHAAPAVADEPWGTS
ncbi:RNA polymerase sigma factor [Streptomyces sp. NPDC051636]|uniref:RNA polymerase sigma factor n=1 Tax=Streptomyces sp. NPDC051636 TaxID=3365663 RepID=UPI003793FDC6